MSPLQMAPISWGHKKYCSNVPVKQKERGGLLHGCLLTKRGQITCSNNQADVLSLFQIFLELPQRKRLCNVQQWPKRRPEHLLLIATFVLIGGNATVVFCWPRKKVARLEFFIHSNRIGGFPSFCSVAMDDGGGLVDSISPVYLR